jgi:hypothetical protein
MVQGAKNGRIEVLSGGGLPEILAFGSFVIVNE